MHKHSVIVKLKNGMLALKGFVAVGLLVVFSPVGVPSVLLLKGYRFVTDTRPEVYEEFAAYFWPILAVDKVLGKAKCAFL